MQLDKRQQFSEIVLMIRESHYNAAKAINTELINLYWNVGQYISKQLASATWGDKTVEELAAFIQKEYPDVKGFNRRGLYRMKQFYETYTSMSFVSSSMTQIQNANKKPDKIVSSAMTQFAFQDVRDTILAKVSWTHHLALMSRIKTDEEREFYLQLSIKEKYTVKELERQINSGTFERVMIGNAKLSPIIREIHPDITNNFKDSYVLEFLGLPEPHDESDLQKGLIAKMRNFILELGKDFLFVGEEYRVQVGNSDFYIDLLFFHRGLQCLIAFELKADKFKPEHLGQLNFYLEALDRDVKKPNENPSIGVLLCKDKDTEVVEYALSRYLSPTMVSEYQTQLPDKKILQRKLHELFDK
ncbi:MAG: PDDEXK nuclease domain-containing protein [Dysgonamonadaceae bacterium]|jgi:predicted nuclease of restriction endonuclease-like (RecB) superfamily|nr:PDDEXK nuclease domain-containing protein [Dysgonamonadaceae bacterium]